MSQAKKFVGILTSPKISLTLRAKPSHSDGVSVQISLLQTSDYKDTQEEVCCRINERYTEMPVNSGLRNFGKPKSNEKSPILYL